MVSGEMVEEEIGRNYVYGWKKCPWLTEKCLWLKKLMFMVGGEMFMVHKSTNESKIGKVDIFLNKIYFTILNRNILLKALI